DFERIFEFYQFLADKNGSGLDFLRPDQFQPSRQDPQRNVAALENNHITVAHRGAIRYSKSLGGQIGKLEKSLAFDQPAFEAPIRILELQKLVDRRRAIRPEEHTTELQSQ